MLTDVAFAKKFCVQLKGQELLLSCSGGVDFGSGGVPEAEEGELELPQFLGSLLCSARVLSFYLSQCL